ncbi:MAG: hypothetical protein HOP15_05630, partial [Planctomycetes bacterium]|nr:hypothetical protein [Planctomycetota bacterium]
MAAFPALPLGRRPVRTRLLAVYRFDPALAAELLPANLAPRLVQGHAIAAACYTRLGAARLFPGREGGSDHLAYRIAVRRDDGVEATWIARRETSSWLKARCGSKFLRGEYGRSAFRMKEDAFAIELAVEGERGEEFYLRGEAAAAAPNALFASGQALESFLGEDRLVRPYDVFAPEADELDLAQHFAPESLAVFEARSAFLAEGPFARAAAELDSAWRIVTRRLAGTTARRAAFRMMPERGSPSPAMPSS